MRDLFLRRRVRNIVAVQPAQICIISRWSVVIVALEADRDRCGENLRRDIRALNDYLSQFEGPAKTAGTAINDAYLKAQNQTAGIQSYGNMADLLIAYTLDGLE